MTIEVRQVLIRSQVGVRPNTAAATTGAGTRELERAKAQILAECKAWLREQLAAAKER